MLHSLSCFEEKQLRAPHLQALLMSSAPPSTSTLCIKCHDSVSTQDTIFLRNESFCRFVVLSFFVLLVLLAFTLSSCQTLL